MRCSYAPRCSMNTGSHTSNSWTKSDCGVILDKLKDGKIAPCEELFGKC